MEMDPVGKVIGQRDCFFLTVPLWKRQRGNADEVAVSVFIGSQVACHCPFSEFLILIFFHYVLSIISYPK